MVHDFLILPGSLAYQMAIQDLPPPPDLKDTVDSGGEVALIAPLGCGGLLKAVPLDRALEYMHDGELEQRMDEIEELEPIVWLPGDP